MIRSNSAVFGTLLVLALGVSESRGQQEVGFIEKFALADDRRAVLSELIPGTEDFYYFHVLHYQNEKQLAAAQSMIEQWKTKFGQNQRVSNMLARQMLLAYSENPQRTLEFLRTQLGLQLDHAPPSRDRAADLSTTLDNSLIEPSKLIESAIARDPSLSQIETGALALLLDRKLSPAQLRSVLQRLSRADLPNLVARIAEELTLPDSRGFGWAPVHHQLTLPQLVELLRRQPNLLEQAQFVREYAARLVPAEGVSLTEPPQMRAYLERLGTFVRSLPASQNNLKALVLGNRLRFDLSQGVWNRELFLEYLSLPRNAPYYNLRRFANRQPAMTELNFHMQPQVLLPAMGDDGQLVRRYLEHFLQSEDRLDDYAKHLERSYLDAVYAETKILFGIGEASTWYAKLSPTAQRELRERVEMRFAPVNKSHFAAADAVKLEVELKNVPQLIVKIYQINARNFYRTHNQPIGTDIDLDGLVANVERTLNFTQPGQLRHAETIDLTELEGRGVWVVDLLGAGQRSRAVIHKGGLSSVQRLGDAGHVFQIYDEAGKLSKSAHIELADQRFTPDAHGQIVVPYAEQAVSRPMILVDGDAVSLAIFNHQTESYALKAAFLLDRQSLIAGAQASVVIRTQLRCNERPVSIQLLEDPQLTIVATDIEGIATTQTVTALQLNDKGEFVHKFLVPPRLANVKLNLSGRVYNRSRDERQAVSDSMELACNGILNSAQIGDFFLRQTPLGFHLLVLGRNGEPIPKLPLNVGLKVNSVTEIQQHTLASDAQGRASLGKLDYVQTVTVSAQDVQPANFVLSNASRNWPSRIHANAGEPIELPLGEVEAQVSNFSLVEIRRGLPQQAYVENLKFGTGSLRLVGLPPGDFVLHDHATGATCAVIVSDAPIHGDYLIGKHRFLETQPRQPVVIRETSTDDKIIRVKVSGADALTRIHVVADPIIQPVASASVLNLAFPPLMQQSKATWPTHYVDSLRLDEEYSYILQRQYSAKFPGNLLAQPSLLLHPWETSVTENQAKEAAKGDMLPPSAPAPQSAAESMAREGESIQAAREGWSSFDFLQRGTLLATNIPVGTNGEVAIPLENLGGNSHVTILAIHPTASDSRRVMLPERALATRDGRLKEAFRSEVHLTETQIARTIEPGKKVDLGDARTSRVQIYATLADVYRLYGTLLNNPEWEKFRFVSQWHTLSDEQRRARYTEMACHELNFFLYRQDRAFFDKVVRPLLAQKLEKQLVDRWLLDESLDRFDELWQTERLNTLERILLAQRVANRATGARRWLNDYVVANPINPQLRYLRFEAALRGTALDSEELESSSLNFLSLGLETSGRESKRSLALGERLRERMLDESRSAAGATPALRVEAEGKSQESAERAPGAAGANDAFFFRSDRRSGAAGRLSRLYQSLDKTRQWAESQFYRIRIQNQSPNLIPPNPFWQEYLTQGSDGGFLSQYLDLPVGSINEALCALAVLDLPQETDPPQMVVEGERIVITSSKPAIAFVQSIEPAAAADNANSILVGQDIYLAQPGTSDDTNRPIQDQKLLKGIPYRAALVVTNPTSRQQRVQALAQIPAGSIPLAGSKITRATPVDLAPYSTAQVQYSFYFPVAGNFAHYGAQVNSDGKHLASTASSTLPVLAEPESVDETTWGYISHWASNEKVVEFLAKANLQQIDLSRIAFRMHDKSFFQTATRLLAQNDRLEPALWAYAVKHNAAHEIQQLLQTRRDFLASVGPVLESPLLAVDYRQQLSFEQLDYKPLVVARSHQLGTKRLILNDQMHRQYHQLLELLAYQPKLEDEQKMELCYYLLLQNRIEEAMAWFGRVSVDKLATRMQYDYFDAYFDFYRGKYDRAAEIARRYAELPGPSWRELFAQVVAQVSEREALLQGREPTTLISLDSGVDRSQRMLTDQREVQQARQATEQPALDLQVADGVASIEYRNIAEVRTNYYLMDIELLFSRNPFVSHSSDAPPAIRPNVTEVIELGKAGGLMRLELPREVQNRNVLIEVVAAGLSRSSVLTANSLAVSVVEPMGRVQVLAKNGRQPLEGAYVKVYARHTDGSVRFFKDGYTDLRGQFDYASLSTSDLDTTQRLAILILHPQQGAIVREAQPPTR